MDFGVKMQGGEPVSTMKVSESEGRLEGLATAVTPNKNSSNSSCGGGSSSSGSSRGGSAKGWQYRYGPFSTATQLSCIRFRLMLKSDNIGLADFRYVHNTTLKLLARCPKFPQVCQLGSVYTVIFQKSASFISQMMSHAEGQQRDLIRGIECLPASGHLSSLDQDLLMLKATSMATMNCLNDCFHILQLQHASHQKGSLPSGSDLKCNSTFQKEPEEINADDEVEDTCDNKEDDLGAVEEQRSVILHLLSQLKLGMDLTRVVLPTFILEKRSLLEMYADFMSHPDLFIAISNGATAEDRMIRFVEYYLTSFHEGRKGAIAKKPYNPIIGETFHCSWRMPKREVASSVISSSSTQAVTNHAPPSEEALSQVGSDCYTVRFVAEQVSHHPPVSGFYAECAERKMCVNVHVWTKSKFLGMSIGVTMVGEGILSLLEHGEEYTFSLPCAYARSILTVPWVELGGKVNVNCAKTGYSASITFHTKPFYGGKLHRVTGEVKHNITNTVVCRVQGEWNSVLEFTYSNGETKYVDLTKLAVTKKRVRPLEKQDPFESRRLWRNVTDSLRESEIDKATEHKRTLEERQRTEERHRTETGTPWKTKYFIKEVNRSVEHIDGRNVLR
ncbi:hypothetical protein E2I00_016331 [Balaenoptera physalus]|uniref:Oxysterol-binding protein n=1 Tax=Balaenoptera physalus TaxID=9770 RepID=A0A643BQR1_BALPH|nr:hypothetical protein E2I00_016331 [Balaenoptera physalus]